MLIFLRHFYPFVHMPLWKFPEMQCVFTLAFVSCLYLLRTRVCTDFRNVINKYCIVITPVEQSLQPVDYAWWQKQYTMTETAHIVLALRLPGVNIGYYWRIFAFYAFIRNACSNTCLVFDIAVQVCDWIKWCIGVSSAVFFNLFCITDHFMQ